MKILIVNYYYAPTVGAHVYRWEQIARYWARQGHSVSVVTSRVAGCPDREQVNGVEIIRTGLFAKRRSVLQSSVPSQTSLLQRCKRRLIDGMRRVYRYFYWPDGLWHWMPSLCLILAKLRKRDLDLIISYSPTFSAHVGVLLFKRLSRSSGVRWVADYGDPFSLSESMQPNNFRVYRKLNTFVENRVVCAADQVVFTNHRTCEAYAEAYPAANLAVVPHLVDFSLFRNAKGNVGVVGGLVNLVYVGGFHKGIREPYVMLRFFDHLCRRFPGHFMLNIYGPSNGFDFSNCGPFVKYHGSVERAVAVELMVAADCLVNVDNSNCVMAPSKLVEYVATGRPVINFCGDSPMAGVMEDYARLGKVEKVSAIFDEADVLRVYGFLTSNLSDVLAPGAVDDILREYELDVVAGRYL